MTAVAKDDGPKTKARLFAICAAGALMLGGTVGIAGTALAGYESRNVGSTDSNTRVQGDLKTTGATTAWIKGECDFSVGNIKTPNVQYQTTYKYVKSSGTCWYGVEGAPFPQSSG